MMWWLRLQFVLSSHQRLTADEGEYEVTAETSDGSMALRTVALAKIAEPVSSVLKDGGLCYAPLSVRTARSPRTSHSATLAVTTANVEMPTTIVTPPTIRPATVTGNTSP